MVESFLALEVSQSRSRAVQAQRGFTLIEMSIVLVIIGLIIGGIVKGQEVVGSARLKSQVAQIDAIKGAVYTFQDRYGFLPGDFKGNTPLGLAATLDGDQNGAVAAAGATSMLDTADVSSATESPTAWLQIAAGQLLAGILPQASAGGASAGLAAAGVGVYPGKVGNSFIWSGTFSSVYGPISEMARLQAGTGTPLPVVNASTLSTMDAKFDDSSPGTGSIMMGGGSLTGATSTSGCALAAPAAGAAGSYSPGSGATLTCVIDFLLQ